MAQPVPRYQAWLLLCSVAFIWGSSFILVKRALVFFTPTEMVALRMVIAACIFLPQTAGLLLQVRLQDVLGIVASAIFGLLLPIWAFSMAQTHLSSGLAGALQASSPLFVLLLGKLFFREHITSRQLWGLFLGILGLLGLLCPSKGYAMLKDSGIYGMVGLVGGASYAVKIHLVKRYLRHVPSAVVNGGGFLLTGALGVWVLQQNHSFLHRLTYTPESYQAVGAVLALGVFSSALSAWLFTRLAQIASPVFTSTVSFAVPLVSLLWGVWDGEVLTDRQMASVVLIMAGIYFSRKTATQR